MARETKRFEQEFIASAKEKTGYTLEEWMPIVESCGETKPNAIVKWLKTNHDVNHMQANFIAQIYLNDGKPTQDYDVLLANLFEKTEHQKPIYEALVKVIEETFTDEEDVICVPTKSYVSIEGNKVFACAKINPKNVRIGLDLGDTPFDDYAQKAKSLGAMPNIGHMIEVTDVDEINDSVASYLRQAYDRVHG